MTIIHKKIKIEGMTCTSCEKIIAKTVLGINGVEEVDVSYVNQNAVVSYDDTKTNLNEIKKKIEEKNYICEFSDEVIRESKQKEIKKNESNNIGWIFLVIGIVIAGYFLLQYTDSIKIPEISTNMGYGLLFVVGLLTGFHCVSMCGGFVVSYTAEGIKEGKKPHQMHISYAIGKVISYTLMGGLFGLIGSFISFTPLMRGIVGIIAGLFLVLFGLKMLNIFPGLRRFSLRMPNFINKFLYKESKDYSKDPFVIGLLNGLMIACGPLQAMYIMAAGTGYMIEGAKLLFIFSLGTLPVMLGFGYLTSFIGSKATHKILKASGIIVLILGLIMFNRGLALTGSGYDINSLKLKFVGETNLNNQIDSGIAIQKNGYQEIRMDVTFNGYEPDKFVLKKGVPVKWIINGKGLTGCNSGIQVPSLNLKFEVKTGEQVIEFTPEKEGVISWSCWMGMIPGTFIVTETGQATESQIAGASVKESTGGSCMASGGGCGCGMR